MYCHGFHVHFSPFLSFGINILRILCENHLIFVGRKQGTDKTKNIEGGHRKNACKNTSNLKI